MLPDETNVPEDDLLANLKTMREQFGADPQVLPHVETTINALEHISDGVDSGDTSTD